VRLAQQVAIVTGATSGIGRAIALLFAKEGAQIAVIGRDAARGEQTCQEIEALGQRAVFIPTEITEEKDVEEMVATTLAEFGQIDILVNNAGVVFPGSVIDTDLETWRKIYDVNVTGAYLASRYVIPHMLERQRGAILNISSEAGLKGLKERAAYCTAKAALIGLTKAMAVDHSPDGIRVNALCPGTVLTPMVQNLLDENPDPDALMERFLSRRCTTFLGTPEEVAQAALYLVSPEARYTTGAVLAVDGGASAK
jgi:NAD(P)-dependent dehydrogenase (short-subunit alcohol dehydrogenase family)